MDMLRDAVMREAIAPARRARLGRRPSIAAEEFWKSAAGR